MNSFLESQARCFEEGLPRSFLTRTTPGGLIARLLSRSRWSRGFLISLAVVEDALARTLDSTPKLKIRASPRRKMISRLSF